MNREEAIAQGIKVPETRHSMKRRSIWHDYHRKGTYMLTLVVEGRVPLLGTLKGSVDAPYIDLSELGDTILRDEIAKISTFYPEIEVWQVCIMPDHIHMIVRVTEDMGDKHLGQVVAGFKGGCTKAWRRIGATVPCAFAQGINQSGRSGNGSSKIPQTLGQKKPLFEEGYNDKILLHEGQLDRWKAYLDDNPRRLFLKRENPDLFTVLSDMEIAEHKCRIVGNRFLLDIPDKMEVIVHRRYTDEENARLREEWLACGERGGVLVSAAIAPKEKEVLREAMDRGYRIILLRENGFPEFYKPSGEAFDACAEGLLLQISPWDYHMEQSAITRAQCLELNAMAEKIANARYNSRGRASTI